MEVDPTPEAEYEALHSSMQGGWLTIPSEWVESVWVEISARWAQGNWVATLLWIGEQLKALPGAALVEWRSISLLLLALVLVVTFLRARWRKTSRGRRAPRVSQQDSATTPSELIELVCRLDHLWARQGFAQPASRAPLEHLGHIPAGKISPLLQDSSRRIIECFYRTSFGGAPFNPSETRELRRSLEQADAIQST